MVNETLTFGTDPAAGHPERVLALSYVPTDRRPTLLALFALDATLAKLALGTREPLVAQMRLTWWYEALSGLAVMAPPAQPILQVLHASRVDGPALATMIEGWERLLGETDEAALTLFSAARSTLFRVAATALDARDTTDTAGQGWALADLARVSARLETREISARMASPLLAMACGAQWSAAGRPLGALAHSARMDLAARNAPGSPTRVARLAWYRLSGR